MGQGRTQRTPPVCTGADSEQWGCSSQLIVCGRAGISKVWVTVVKESAVWAGQLWAGHAHPAFKSPNFISFHPPAMPMAGLDLCKGLTHGVTSQFRSAGMVKSSAFLRVCMK